MLSGERISSMEQRKRNQTTVASGVFRSVISGSNAPDLGESPRSLDVFFTWFVESIRLTCSRRSSVFHDQSEIVHAGGTFDR